MIKPAHHYPLRDLPLLPPCARQILESLLFDAFKPRHSLSAATTPIPSLNVKTIRKRSQTCIPISTPKITEVNRSLRPSPAFALADPTDPLAACEEVMALLDECHARGFMIKALGVCNSAKTNVNRCLRAQRLERTAKNREAAKIKRAETKALFAKIDAES